MELFRQLGLQGDIEDAAQRAWEIGAFGGARRGRTMLCSEELEIPDTTVMTGNDPSPCRMVACPQTLVEPILRQALEERGGDVRFGCELLDFAQHGNGVRATIRDASGREQLVQAAYLVAADGSRGATRRRLSIDRHGGAAARHYYNVYFEADLTEKVRGQTFSQCEVANDRVRGLFLSMNNTTKWSFHLLHDPDLVQPEQWSDAMVADAVRAAIGDDLPVSVRHRGAWTAVARVADSYREGRVFLVGDTAHIMPPWGGLNGNTGIADAHNLAWKLAQVLQGDASPKLLDSYEAERRPIALRNAEQAELRSDFELRFGIRTATNHVAFNRLRDGGELLMRYRYGHDDTVAALQGQEGTRFPHAWIEQGGRRRSTLDLFGHGAVTIGGVAAASSDLQVDTDFSFADRGVTWQTLTGRQDDAVIQVRPDGVVAF